MKDIPFEWSESCQNSFDTLKKYLTISPINQPPDWSQAFELMCDASDHAIGVVLGQWKDKTPSIIYHASRTLNHAQENNSLANGQEFYWHSR